MGTKRRSVKVKECVVDGKQVYGITSGKRWFFYAYETKERAELMLEHFRSPTMIDLNITSIEPRQIVEE